MKNLSKKIGTILVTLAMVFTSFVPQTFAVTFRLSGSSDVSTMVGEYKERWVVVSDGIDVVARLRSLDDGISLVGGKQTNSSELERLVNNQRAGRYKITYNAIEDGRVFDGKTRIVHLVSAGGNGGSGGGDTYFSWDEYSWGNCVNNTQTRTVICEDQNDDRVSNSKCDSSTKPATTKSCVSNTYSWDTGAWNTCVNNYQTRTVICEDQNGSRVSDSRCNSGAEPDDSRSCNSGSDDTDIQTFSARNIDDESATLRGEVSEGDDVRVWFAFDDSSSVSCYDSSDRESVYGRYDDGDDFDLDIFDLDDGEYYYFRACAEDEDGYTISGGLESFRTDGGSSSSDDVEVETFSARNIDDESATLRGEVSEGDDVRVWFAIDYSSSVSCSDSSDREYVSGRYDEGDDFDLDIDDLDEGDRYYFRACAEDEDGDTVSGERRYFTAGDDDNDDDVEIATSSASDIDEDSVELNGVVEEGDDVKVWFVMSRTDSTPSCSSSNKYKISREYDEDDDFSKRITGLRDEERYYFRACGEDEDGDDVSGSIFSFITEETGNKHGLEAITYNASNIRSNYAQLNGYVRTNNEPIAAYFEWGRTSLLGNRTTVQAKNKFSTSLIHSFSQLSSNTNYCYRAVIENTEGSDKGSIKCFRTLGGGVVSSFDIETNDNAKVGKDEATISGEVTDGTNVKVWFALDNSPDVSCKDTSDKVTVSGLYDDGEDFSRKVTNLIEGDRYYFRACGQKNSTIISGDLENFRFGYNYGFGLSLVQLDIENHREHLSKGDDIQYDVEWKNISDIDLEDLVLQVEIPKEIELTGTSAGRLNKGENTVTLNVSDLEADESGTLELFGTVNKRMDDGDTIVAVATISFRNPINEARENAVAYDDDLYFVESNGLMAGIFAMGDLGGFGWLLSFLLLVILILLGRWIYLEGKNREKTNVKSTTTNENPVENDYPQSNYIPYRPNRS